MWALVIVVSMVIPTQIASAQPAFINLPPLPTQQSQAAQAASISPATAISAATANSTSRGVTSYISMVDRSTGKVVAETANANTQVASASIMKLFLATYYAVQAGGYSKMSASMRGSMEYMMKYSDDGTASSVFTASAIPSMAARYGLSNTANAANVGHWGAARITAHDMAQFLYRMSRDSLVGPWLVPLMAQTAANGSDGFNQKFGFNALTGVHGSKQGWSSDNWTAQRNVIHSVGYTSRWFSAVLQTSSSSYSIMSTTATYSAQKVQSASGSIAPAPRVPKSQADRYIKRLTQTLLGRNPTGTATSLQLQKGQITKEDVVRNLVGSAEYRGVLVDRAYQTCLGRKADAGGKRAYAASMATGRTADLYASICSSKEARTVNGSGSINNQVANIFSRLVGAKATGAQVATLVKTWSKSGWSAVVKQIVNSAQWGSARLSQLYRTMVQAATSPGGRATYLKSMSGRGDFTAPVGIAASKRFWQLAQR